MRKIIRFASAFLCLSALVFVGCANDLQLKNEELYEAQTGSRTLVPDDKCTTQINVHVLYAPGDSLVAWSWAKYSGGEQNYKCDVWDDKGTKGLVLTKRGVQFDLTYRVDNTADLGILFVSAAGQTGDIIIPKNRLTADANFYFIYGQTDIFSSAEECTGLKKASIISADGNTVSLVVFGFAGAEKEAFSVKDSDGNALTVSSVDAEDTSATLTLSNGDVSKRPYSVSVGSETVSANISSDLIDELKLKYDGDDLGVKITGSSATFKMWAPTASSVSILFYDDVSKIGTYKPATVAAKAHGGTDETELLGEPSGTEIMTPDIKTGVWSYVLDTIGSKKYYKYQIEINDQTFYVCDINAKVCAPDSIAAQIVDINSDESAVPSGLSYGTKESYKNPFSGSYTDAVIYEMHIRDWSRAVNPSSQGRFTELCDRKIIGHLTDLGITHVQILPMFDYAQINADEKYNWGYNPYHYNVPEGRYADYSADRDGTAAVKQMREMIKTLHDKKIAVIMDVVYNHTSGTLTGSLYDSTVPGYFYRQKADGSYYNGSGCGNEIATNHTMVKKYVIDSLKHWMLDYHINGFRFDLMGCLEKDTMKEIYDELRNIDPNVMVYGEPWTGGDSGVAEEKGATSAVEGTSGNGVGAFDDDFRDALKGTDGFGGLHHGQLAGTFNDAVVVLGLKGAEISSKNKRNPTGKPGLALHYVECHDNYTLFDKLVYAFDSKISGDGNWAPKFADLYRSVMSDISKLDLVKKQEKLAAAYVILSQGTPFINGGQEFMRTKKGNPDSYSADTKGGITWTNTPGQYNIDDCNTIDLDFRTTYSDVYNTYKGLIKLRKSSPAFTNGTESTARTLSKGVTLYTARSGSEAFEVLFNSTDSEYALTDAIIEGKLGLGVSDYEVSFGRKGKRVTISETDGTFSVADAETTVSSVPAKSFVILKK